MKTILFPIFLTVIVLISCTPVENQTPVWPEPTMESKPWTRWWWMGNAVDRENLVRELDEMAEMGIGGVEITPIYGVKGEEERGIEFLSPGFTEIINFTVDEAGKRGMGVDLPAGSGWRNGGPFVPEEKGLWNLKVEKIPLKAGDTWKQTEKTKNATTALFVAEDGKKQVVGLHDKFTAGKAGTLYIALRVKSRDKVKRPAKGGEGWAIDTFNEEITNWYLGEFWKRLGVDEGKLRCFFHDSFEYTGDFTTHFLTEFKTRRGYDMAEYLHVLAGDCEDGQMVARVKSDYRETLSDLVLESFIQPMTDWANSHQSLNRNQAHGSPGNILDLYAACDIPETEIFRHVEPGTVDVFVNKYASSAAHVTGQKLVSSESYTWLEEHWTVTTSDMVRATNRFFLAGINHMFFHGTCYSPDDAQWPGWLFYASTQVNNRNPLWREMPTLFKYIERAQTILQAAQPQNDLLIYWPYFDVAAGEGRIFNHLGVNKDAGWFKNHPISGLSETLMAEGYTFDYISDRQLDGCRVEGNQILTSGNAQYKAIVVPVTGYIPLATMEKLAEFIEYGGTVVFDKVLPKSVPGMFDLENREQQLAAIKEKIESKNLAGDVTQMLQNADVLGEGSLTGKGFRFLKMKLDGDTWYMVFNTGLETLDEWVELDTPAKDYLLYDPMTGEITRAGSKKNSVRLQLEPEQAMFVRCTDRKAGVPAFVYAESKSEPVEAGSLWKIEFLEGGPVYPGNIQTDELLSWTQMGDQQTERFAGTARYSTTFNWAGKSNSAVLDLGDVRDCARVILNDKEQGTLLGPSFKLKTNDLVQGNNKLVIEVTNVAANRIRDLDIKGVEWRKFHDINFVNIDYRPFDASGWEVRDAGLLGPVTLQEL